MLVVPTLILELELKGFKYLLSNKTVLCYTNFSIKSSDSGYFRNKIKGLNEAKLEQLESEIELTLKHVASVLTINTTERPLKEIVTTIIDYLQQQKVILC